NVDDEILQNVMTKISIPTSGQSITYDIIEVQASSQTADEIAMVVLSTKLAGGIGQGYNATHEFKGPCILETNTYCLRDDDSRTTTILETNDTKAKIRVEGKFNNEASTDYLDDESGTPVDLTVKVDYTFTVDGIFIENMTDFQSVGITLDTDSGHNGYEWLGIWADLNDETFDDTGNIIYGNGTTEATTTTDGAEFEDLNKYVVLPGTGSDTYQDAFIGIQKYGWYDDTGGTDEWHWDEANSGTQDLITTQEQDHLTSGKHYAKWFFLMLAEDNVDTQAERESYINDYRNPDTLVYTTGSEWDDAPASPGVNFDAIDDDIDCGIDSSLDLGTNMTIEAWIYPTGYGEGGYGTIVARGAGDGTGYQFYTRNASQSLAIWDAGNEVSTTDSIELNAWQHVAVVINGGNLSKFYVNGNDVTLATNFDLATSGSNTFYIGSFDGATDTFDGIIDEVRIWSEARTQEEIQQNMFKQLIGSESNLNGYWRLNENVGTTAYDETINNNDGVLTSGPTWQTGFVADHYNESEGAYTINTSTNQIEIDIDGGTYTRHNPNLKIRQYFLNTKPSTVL
ncbi:MAG: LamG domain-containing protein, partial [Nanoarchaeota archaeon]|nr:LamG domain-containing protein [Nanoarchaeota archaeon]